MLAAFEVISPHVPEEPTHTCTLSCTSQISTPTGGEGQN